MLECLDHCCECRSAPRRGNLVLEREPVFACKLRADITTHHDAYTATTRTNGSFHTRKRTFQLASSHGLPDISSLLSDLNDARKASAYGDTAFPDLDADDLIREIQEYVERVGELLDSDFDDE